jgi:hypothetical protein
MLGLPRTFDYKSLLVHLLVFTSSEIKKDRSLFSVANSMQEFLALHITKGGVRGDVGSKKHTKNL